MNEEKFEKERKEREFKLNLDLINEDVGQANIKEKEFKDQCEKEEKERKNRRLDIQKEWKELWGEIWIPNIAYNGDESLVNKRNLIQKIIMEVTFKIFKKEMYDVWKFKNILNNKDQYIIMEKIKKYLNEIEYNNDINVNHINNKRKDEDAFDKMTNIIESIRREEEIIYCDLGSAKEKLAMIASENENESAKRISNLIQKIENLQVKSSELDVFSMFKDSGDGTIDATKVMIKALEEKIFKKFELVDARYKKDSLDNLKMKNKKLLKQVNLLKDNSYKNDVKNILILQNIHNIYYKLL